MTAMQATAIGIRVGLRPRSPGAAVTRAKGAQATTQVTLQRQLSRMSHRTWDLSTTVITTAPVIPRVTTTTTPITQALRPLSTMFTTTTTGLLAMRATTVEQLDITAAPLGTTAEPLGTTVVHGCPWCDFVGTTR